MLLDARLKCVAIVVSVIQQLRPVQRLVDRFANAPCYAGESSHNRDGSTNDDEALSLRRPDLN